MRGATGAPARSVRLVQVIGSLTDILRALGRFNATDIAAELLFEVNFALLASALDTTAAHIDITRVLVFAGACRRVRLFLCQLPGHVVGILNHICLEVRVEVLWHISEKVCVRDSMILILPSFVKFVLTVHIG